MTPEIRELIYRLETSCSGIPLPHRKSIYRCGCGAMIDIDVGRYEDVLGFGRETATTVVFASGRSLEILARRMLIACPAIVVRKPWGGS